MTYPTTRLFGLPIVNITLDQATGDILSAARERQRRLIFFVNAHCINLAARDPGYLRTLRAAHRLYADGSGMALAGRMAGAPLKGNVNGTDMFPLLCDNAARDGVPLAFLGAKSEIVHQCAENMRRRFPGLQIPWVHHGYFTPGEEPRLIEQINRSGARVLLVAMGVPSQELWINRCASQLEPPVILGVGGLFDFYSGLRRRAPAWLRKTGLEWTCRLAQEPRRLFARYVLGNPIFLARALRLRLRGDETLRSGGDTFALTDAGE